MTNFDSKYSINKIPKSYASAKNEDGEYLTIDEYETIFGTIVPDYAVDDEGNMMVADTYYKPDDSTISIGLTFKF